MFYAIQKLETITSAEAGYLRALINSIISYFLMVRTNVEIHPKNEVSIRTCLMVLTLGSTAFLFMFLGADMISVSQMSVLFQTNSIWVPILSVFILKQNITIYKALMIFFSFAGVIMIIDPSILYLDSTGSLSDISSQIITNSENSQTKMYIGSFFGLITGFIVGLKRCYTIKNKDAIHSLHNIFYFQLGSVFTMA